MLRVMVLNGQCSFPLEVQKICIPLSFDEVRDYGWPDGVFQFGTVLQHSKVVL